MCRNASFCLRGGTELNEPFNLTSLTRVSVGGRASVMTLVEKSVLLPRRQNPLDFDTVRRPLKEAFLALKIVILDYSCPF